MYFDQYSAGHPMENRISSIMQAVYGWMSVALFVSAGTAYYVGNTPALYEPLLKTPSLFFGLFLLQIGLVIGLSAFLSRMNFVTAAAMFVLYAATLGVTLSTIFLVYEISSIGITFLVTAGMFGGMALYGYATKSDLTGVGSISIMMLFGLIIGGLVNLFLRNPMIDLMLSAIGVIVFALLTAYDVQKIKQMSQQLLADRQTTGKIALLGALTLYLDFVNLFLYLLRFFGKKKEQ